MNALLGLLKMIMMLMMMTTKFNNVFINTISSSTIFAICNAERCNSYDNYVCPSVCPSHAGTLSRRMKIGSCGLHCEVANTL